MQQANLIERIAESFRQNWDHKAFTDYEASSLTFGDTAHRIFRLHYIFEHCGVRRGDKIALAGRNSTNWAITYLATVTYGAVIVPILPDFTNDEIQHIVGHSDAVMVFVSDQIYDRIEERKLPNAKAFFALGDLSLRYCPDPRAEEIAAGSVSRYQERFGDLLSPEQLRFREIPNDALHSIVYTSGTTGFSKGVMLTHGSLMANARYYVDNMDLKAGQDVMSFLPLAHAFGCAFEFVSPVVAGAHVTFIEKIPTPKVLMQAFQAVRPRLILSVPLIIEKIYKTRLRPLLDTRKIQLMMKTPLVNKLIARKIRTQVGEAFGGNFQELVVGGAALNSEVEQFFRGIGFPLSCGYGMTECGPLISHTVVTKNPPAGSVGKVVPYLECKIEYGDPGSDVGEVLVRGVGVMRGYYKDEDATRSAIDPDGWLHTGDLGRLDKNGFLFLTGRSKNMILSASGQNIYPEEIESKLNNLPFVQESLIMDKNGRLVALVYPDVEAVDEGGVSEKELGEIMEQNRLDLNTDLPAFSSVTRIQLIFEEFEKTPTKKIKRRLYNILD